MEGQIRLRRIIDSWKDKNYLPRLILIKGQKGQGRFTLAKYISKVFSLTPTICENNIDSVRNVIKSSYSVQERTLYMFNNIDEMSLQAINSFLKVCEEPPNNAHFILTTSSNTLETIKSRSTELVLDPYAKVSLMMFTTNEEIVNYINNPGTLIDLRGIEEEFLAYCKLVANQVDKVTGTNAFKIPLKLKLKEKDEGYNPKDFVEVTTKMVTQRKGLTRNQLVELLNIHDKVQNALNSKSAKKDQAVDIWLLDLRKVLMK